MSKAIFKLTFEGQSLVSHRDADDILNKYGEVTIVELSRNTFRVEYEDVRAANHAFRDLHNSKIFQLILKISEI